MKAVSDRWLTLKVSDPLKKPQSSPETTVFFSIPKRSVRLATDRNRLRRVLREALRTGGFKLRPGKIYSFRVIQKPGPVGLGEILRVVRELLDPGPRSL
ncbi:MAG TPA: ribonuclease P protein component [Candidatus Omnitrophota bacterium]|nr:ribonuclease P protein component [Candidatus Omnitrophota bacterium]